MRESVGDRLTATDSGPSGLSLADGARVAIVGGGPAGSFTAIFLSQMADRAGLDLEIELFEPRSFERGGPAGCNHCGGIVSESLVQTLAAEGINLPPSVVQRGIESYGLHMDQGSVAIASPVEEQRIAAVYRGNGPRGGEDMPWDSFDGFLMGMAAEAGARVRARLVLGLEHEGDKPVLRVADGTTEPFDLVVIASGVNSNLLAQVETDRETPTRRRVRRARTYICEFRSDGETIKRTLGNSMHVFMVDLPGVEFAALIPKGDYITLAMLGDDIDPETVHAFLAHPAVREAFPFDWIPSVCSCTPCINVAGPVKPFLDRIVMVGDAGVTRLYKDGIGAAHRTAKAAANTAVLYGVDEGSFAEHYSPVCRDIRRDNRYGRILFAFTWLFRKVRVLRRAVLRMVESEQRRGGGPMSAALWNLFTGSAPYREVFWTTVRPTFLMRLLGHTVASLRPRRRKEKVDAAA